MFAGRILPISEDVMLRWRLLVDDGCKIRHTFSQPDLIIAATALHHDLTVMSRDVSDFVAARAPVFNPWPRARSLEAGAHARRDASALVCRRRPRSSR